MRELSMAETHGPDIDGYIRLEVHTFCGPHTQYLVKEVLEWERTGDNSSLLKAMENLPRAKMKRPRTDETPYD